MIIQFVVAIILSTGIAVFEDMTKWHTITIIKFVYIKANNKVLKAKPLDKCILEFITNHNNETWN